MLAGANSPPTISQGVGRRHQEAAVRVRRGLSTSGHGIGFVGGLEACQAFHHLHSGLGRPHRLKIGPSVNLRPLSARIRGESVSSSERPSVTEGDGIFSDMDHRVPPTDITATEFSNFSCQPCLDLQSTVICSSLRTRSIFLRRWKEFYCSWRGYQSLIALLLRAPIILFFKIADKRPLHNLAKIYGRVLLIGLFFVALDLTGGRMSSRHALALPAAATTESLKRPEVEEAKKSRRFGRAFRGRTEIFEQRLLELTDPESGSAFVDQLLEDISVADKKQLEEYLELLKQADRLLGRQVDDAVYEYLATQDELERVRDDVVIAEKEEVLKEKGDILANYRGRLLEIVALVTKISQRMKQLTPSRFGNDSSFL